MINNNYEIADAHDKKFPTVDRTKKLKNDPIYVIAFTEYRNSTRRYILYVFSCVAITDMLSKPSRGYPALKTVHCLCLLSVNLLDSHPERTPEPLCPEWSNGA